MQYVAFLRGINVGGRQIKMEALKHVFSELGFTKIQTILASGNVIFETTAKDKAALKETIEKALQKAFGFAITIFLRSIEDLTLLLKKDPFKKIIVTAQTRLYIVFLSENVKGTLSLPYASPEKDCHIVRLSDGELAATLQLSDGRGTVDMMGIIGKAFGNTTTTRNWNTLKKIVAKA